MSRWEIWKPPVERIGICSTEIVVIPWCRLTKNLMIAKVIYPTWWQKWKQSLNLPGCQRPWIGRLDFVMLITVILCCYWCAQKFVGYFCFSSSRCRNRIYCSGNQNVQYVRQTGSGCWYKEFLWSPLSCPGCLDSGMSSPRDWAIMEYCTCNVQIWVGNEFYRCTALLWSVLHRTDEVNRPRWQEIVELIAKICGGAVKWREDVQLTSNGWKMLNPIGKFKRSILHLNRPLHHWVDVSMKLTIGIYISKNKSPSHMHFIYKVIVSELPHTCHTYTSPGVPGIPVTGSPS